MCLTRCLLYRSSAPFSFLKRCLNVFSLHTYCAVPFPRGTACFLLQRLESVSFLLSARIISKPEGDEDEDLGLMWELDLFEFFITQGRHSFSLISKQKSEHGPSVQGGDRRVKINCLWLKMAESESAKHAFKRCLFSVK